jgi:hypothetical protein
MVVSLITKALSKVKSAKDTVKVYRGEYLPEKKPFTVPKKGRDFEHLRNREDIIERGLTPESLAKKVNTAEGRYFSTNRDLAKIFSKGDKGRVVEAEISKKDLELGKKLKEKFFKFGSDGGSPDTLLIPKKNLKDVKENIDSFKDKVGTIAATEYEKGGFVNMTKDKKYYKGIL